MRHSGERQTGKRSGNGGSGFRKLNARPPLNEHRMNTPKAPPENHRHTAATNVFRSMLSASSAHLILRKAICGSAAADNPGRTIFGLPAAGLFSPDTFLIRQAVSAKPGPSLHLLNSCAT
jgi:hypothetical protein